MSADGTTGFLTYRFIEQKDLKFYWQGLWGYLVKPYHFVVEDTEAQR